MSYPRQTIQYQSHATPVDMTFRPWGELTAIEPTWRGYWRFRCQRGHESILHGSSVRCAAVKVESQNKGIYQRCPECRRERRAT